MGLVPLVPVALGLGAWGLALRSLGRTSLGTRDVPAALPLTWWISVAVLLAGGVFASSARVPRGWVVAAYVAALAMVLYGTLPAVLDAPQYAWTYKHIGVVRLIELRGTVFPNVDIYNRWPGFFAAAAGLSALMGLFDPVSYAAWSELLFALVDALLVAALARAVVRDARIAGLATIIFTLGDWIGQGYFSPQATVYPVSLALLLIVMRQFAGGAVNARTVRLAELVVRRAQLPPAGRAVPDQRRAWPRWAAAAIILGLDSAIVASHQLTPYVLVMQVGGLAVIGVLRPRWILAAMAAITVGYLLPNLGFVVRNYGLFTSLDPFANAQATADTARPITEPWIDQHAGQLLSLVLVGGAAIASLALLRRGLARTAAPLIVLAAMPVGLLFAQGYGGEASLRTFLFSSPWDAILIAWAILGRPATRVTRVVALGLCAMIAALFVPAFFGQTSTNVITAQEVAASEYFYSHAPAGSLLVQAAPNFPTRSGARYPLMRTLSQKEDAPNLLDGGKLAHKPLDARSIGAMRRVVGTSLAKVYLEFSSSNARIADVDALTPPGALGRLEQAVAVSELFRLWYGNRDARIYSLLNTKDTMEDLDKLAAPVPAQPPPGSSRSSHGPIFFLPGIGCALSAPGLTCF